MAIDPEQKRLWLYELDLNGFIVFRNFLPVALVEAMHEEFLPLYKGELTRVMSGDTTTLRGRNRMSFDIAAYVDKLKGPLDDDRFRRNPVIEELAEAVLGGWRYGVTKAECPFKDSDTMVWHPDMRNVDPGDPVTKVVSKRLTFNVPLVDINDSKGPMEIIPGSHRMCHRGTEKSIYWIPQVYSTKVLMKLGDAMLRDGNALHRGTPNLTDEPRILLDQTYRALED